MMDVTYFGGYSGHDVKLSTFNNETVYAAVHMELFDGPVVCEQPAMDDKGYLFGSIIDVWQVALTDLGIPEVTPDQGKGVGAFRLMHDYINKEPVQEKDKYPIGMLRSLGIEKGQPFPRDRKTLGLLQRAADLGWMTAKYNMTQSWPPSVLDGWKALGLAETWDPGFTTDEYIQADERAAYFGLAIWPPQNMGGSTYYAITFSDTGDRPLEPGKSYKLHLPPNGPDLDRLGSDWAATRPELRSDK